MWLLTDPIVRSKRQEADPLRLREYRCCRCCHGLFTQVRRRALLDIEVMAFLGFCALMSTRCNWLQSHTYDTFIALLFLLQLRCVGLRLCAISVSWLRWMELSGHAKNWRMTVDVIGVLRVERQRRTASSLNSGYLFPSSGSLPLFGSSQRKTRVMTVVLFPNRYL